MAKKKSLKKKILIGVTSFILFILLSMILVPIIFKDKIIEKIKQETNKKLNAVVNFEDVKLNLFSNFPNFSLSITNISVANIEPFKGDTLAKVGKLQASLDLFNVISGDKITIKKIKVVEPTINVKILEDGKANYDIAKPTEEIEDQDTSSNFNMEISSYIIERANVIYDDKSLDMYLNINNLNHKGEGNFNADIYDFKTKTTVDECSFAYQKAKYVNKMKLDFDITIKMDMKNMKFTFKENKLNFNEFPLNFDGWLELEKDDINMDITFQSPNATFKSLLSIIPMMYTEDFKDVKTSGNLNFKGFVKGVYNEKQMPAFDLNMIVNNAMFKYPDLPKAIEKININLAVACADGVLDNTIVNLSKMTFAMGKAPFKLRMLLKTPISDPYIDFGFETKINMKTIEDFYPLQDQLSGNLESKFDIKGNISALEKEEYDKFLAEGFLKVNDFKMKSDLATKTIQISEMLMNFNPKTITLDKFNMKVGKTDFSADAKLENLMAYIFKNQTLSGNFNFNSNYFNVNTFMGEENEEPQQTQEPQTELEAPEIPKNIDFTMSGKINTLHYDNMDLNDAQCVIKVQDQTLLIQKIVAGLFEGKINIDGFYSTKKRKPEVAMKTDIKSISIPDAYKTFVTMREFVPIAKYMHGNFDVNLQFISQMNKDMSLITKSLNSNGKINIYNLKIDQMPVLEQIAQLLKKPKYKTLQLKTLLANYSINNGRFYIKPLKYQHSGQQFELSGWNDIEGKSNYNLTTKVPMGVVKSEASKSPGMKNLISNMEAKGVDLNKDIDVGMNITGSLLKPKIMFKANTDHLKEDIKNKIIDQTKNQIKDKIDDKKDELKNKTEEEARKKLKEEEEARKKLEDEARKKLEDEKKKKMNNLFNR